MKNSCAIKICCLWYQYSLYSKNSCGILLYITAFVLKSHDIYSECQPSRVRQLASTTSSGPYRPANPKIQTWSDCICSASEVFLLFHLLLNGPYTECAFPHMRLSLTLFLIPKLLKHRQLYRCLHVATDLVLPLKGLFPHVNTTHTIIVSIKLLYIT